MAKTLANNLQSKRKGDEIVQALSVPLRKVLNTSWKLLREHCSFGIKLDWADAYELDDHMNTLNRQENLLDHLDESDLAGKKMTSELDSS